MHENKIFSVQSHNNFTLRLKCCHAVRLWYTCDCIKILWLSKILCLSATVGGSEAVLSLTSSITVSSYNQSPRHHHHCNFLSPLSFLLSSLSLSPLSLFLSHPRPLSGCIPVVVCHESKVEQIFKQADSCRTLYTIIKIGGATITDEEKTLSKETGITIHTMDEVMVSKKFYHSGKCSE